MTRREVAHHPEPRHDSPWVLARQDQLAVQHSNRCSDWTRIELHLAQLRQPPRELAIQVSLGADDHILLVMSDQDW